MQNYLSISYDILSSNEVRTCDDSTNFKYRLTPFFSSEVLSLPIHSYEILIDEGNRKVFKLNFSSHNTFFNFEPGLTLGVLPNNDENEVDQLLMRLGVESVADNYFKLGILSNTKRKNACIPKHIPECCSLRKVFLQHVDIRSVPKKLFLKSLIPYVEDAGERNELELLCSPKGSEQYNELISSYSKRSLLGLLNRFTTCNPPVEKLLEYLPPLLPRPYSISSSPLIKEYFTITFNVDTFSNNEKSLCSSWLEKAFMSLRKQFL
ncbi:hypothetical protein HHI36_017189 [Cryptolaemus montrouzieri]|uniref:Methionine synthase reductase n=1 Tax=Cryptolaemus montrouzieri TaxID=559131 RepID=A0ABD2NM66_9CUCU